MSGPGDGTDLPADRPAGQTRRAGHENDLDYVDKDVVQPPGTAREGDYVDKDVDPGAPDATREGDYTDKDVSEDDTDTPPSSYVSRDVPP